MTKSVSRLIAVFSLSVLMLATSAQSFTKENKPYKVLTSGRQLTIKSIKTIQGIMVWTVDGHRVVEQKGLNDNTVKIDIPVLRNSFYLMIAFQGGKIYTERVGIQ